MSLQNKIIYIGNIHYSVTDELILALFGKIGAVKSYQIFAEGVNDSYCFLEYVDYQSSLCAIGSMNGRKLMGKELKVHWAETTENHSSRVVSSYHFHVFVGDLCPEIDTQLLRDAFSSFGDVSDCRVVRDSLTLKSKGYGFVSYVNKNEAESAILSMNGQLLGSRNIRTNWASRKPLPLKISDTANNSSGASTGNSSLTASRSSALTYEEVFEQTSPTNCTVYCGGIMTGLSDQLVYATFAPYGQILEVRVFRDKGYAFIRFSNKESATNAIVNSHNSVISGHQVKCAWGKESCDSQTSLTAANSAAFASLSIPPACHMIPAAAAASSGIPYPYTVYCQSAPPSAGTGAFGAYWYHPAAYSPTAAYPQPYAAYQPLNYQHGMGFPVQYAVTTGQVASLTSPTAFLSPTHTYGLPSLQSFQVL